MYVKFRCPECGKNLKCPEDLVGQSVRCPHCHHSVVVPAKEVKSSSAPSIEDIIGTTDSASTAGVPPARPKKAATVAATAPVAERSDPTNVDVLWTALLGLAISVVFLAAIFPFRSNYLSAVFVSRGWVPYVETYFFFWAVVILVFKFRKIGRQCEVMLFDLLPGELSEDITPENVDRFLTNIRELPCRPSESFLIHRVQRALEHFRVRKSNPEVATLLASQSAIDGNAVESSYSLLRVFIWAIPILGFIGTVIGIGEAVAGFSGQMNAAADISALKDKLGSITGGLGVAFDTTLVALVMSMILSFPASALQKEEEDILNQIDDYCNENLLIRLRDDGTASGPSIGDLAAVERQIAAFQREQLERLREAAMRIDGHLAGWQKKTDERTAQSVVRLETTLDGVGQQVRSLGAAIEAAIAESSRSFQTHCQAMERGLCSLNDALAALGEKHVVIENHRRRGLLGLFRR